jgi:hypothetical protein
MYADMEYFLYHSPQVLNHPELLNEPLPPIIGTDPETGHPIYQGERSLITDKPVISSDDEF